MADEFWKKSVRELEARAEAVEDENTVLRAAIKLAYQHLQRHDYGDAEDALLGTVPDEPTAVVNRELTTQERKG